MKKEIRSHQKQTCYKLLSLVFLSALSYSASLVEGKPIDTQYGDAGIIMSMR
jgi:hypothetical protein